MDKTLYSALHDEQTQNVTMINSTPPTKRGISLEGFDDTEIIGRGRQNQNLTLVSDRSSMPNADEGQHGGVVEDEDDEDEEDEEGISSQEPEEMCPLVRPSRQHQRNLQQSINSLQQRNHAMRNHLTLPLMTASAVTATTTNSFATNGERRVPPNETFNLKIPFQPKSNFLKQTSVGIIPRLENNVNNVGIQQNSNFPKPTSNGGNKVILVDPMVMIGLNNDDDNDDDQYSSSSPFHSATEDFDVNNDNERDRDPLIKPPAKTGGFHHLLSKSKSKGSSGSTGGGGDDEVNSRDKVLNSGTSKRKCSVGIFLAAISCIFFATSALIVKVSDLHPMELLGVRGLLQGIFVTPLVISTKNSFLGPKGSRSLLLSRAVLGAVALVMSFASIHLIPLADAATVIFTSPVFVSIFACLCLGEVCTWFDVAMIALTLLGVLLVSKPSFGFISTGSWTSIVGTFCGLAAAMLTALAFIVLRQLKHVHYSVTVFWFSTVLASFGAVLTVALDGFALPTTWTYVAECIGIGVCGFLGQILLTKALQMENAGPVAVARTMDIVLAFFYQITFLHDTPDWKSYLGSVLVVSCVLLTAFRRWYKDVKRVDKTTQNATT